MDTKSRAYNFSFSYNNIFQKVHNRQTDRHCTYRSIKTCNMESQVHPCEKANSAESSVTKDDLTEPKQFPAQPSFFSA